MARPGERDALPDAAIRGADDGDSGSSSWHLVVASAEGRPEARDEFVRRYGPVVRAYLEARWRHPVLRQSVDDAVQDTFVDCFRRSGVLSRVDPRKPQRFRAYLYGVTRIVALRFERARRIEARHVPGGESDVAEAPARQESLARTFDRAFVTSLLRRAGELHEERARAKGGDALRRVELLRLRFGDGLAIRDIAARWGVETAWLHHQYAAAREEFRRALLAVAGPELGARDAEAACARLLQII